MVQLIILQQYDISTRIWPGTMREICPSVPPSGLALRILKLTLRPIRLALRLFRLALRLALRPLKLALRPLSMVVLYGTSADVSGRRS